MLFLKPYRRLLFLAAICVVVLLASCAPLTPTMSHQGRLLKPDGDPVADGNYNVIYKFYNAATGGSPAHTTTAQSVAVKDGLFNATVGLSPEDINPEIFALPTWVEVVVNGETLAPRLRLTGSPYAFSLAPGAVVQGPEVVTRTYAGQENTGATFTVWNTDATATGGNGLFVANQAAAEAGAPDGRGNVAALQAIAAGGDAAASPATGAYGAIIKSKAYRGMYVQAETDGYFTAVFDGPLGIYVEGNCTGCTAAYVALNSSDQEITAGAFLTVEGVQVDPDLNVPVMLVRPVSSSSDPVIGVSGSAMTRTAVGDHLGTKTGGFDGTTGPAKPGDYLSVVVSGLVQVQTGAASSLQTGDWITLDGSAVTLAAEGQTGIARLLSEVDSAGFAWILFTGQ